MKRSMVLCMLFLAMAGQFCWAASDLNVMDDIGFNSAYGYYKSANETINMQSGNVILEIPVSPVYPGPEGSGLDLQLKMVYNSQSWKYMPKRGDNLPASQPGNPYYRLDAVVDDNNMQYSPVGFGWTLHMGRLFRKKVNLGGCQEMQFFYEDPSGAMHDFGPLCDTFSEDQPNIYHSQDASDLVLSVTKYFDSSQRQIVMYDGTGKAYFFTDGDANGIDCLDVPHFRTVCGGYDFEPEEGYEGDKVFYLKKITSLTSSACITISYYYPENESDYAGHLIDTISAPYTRDLVFHYTTDNIASLPVLDYISEPGPNGAANDINYHFDYDFVTLSEPWGFADAWMAGENDCGHFINVVELTTIRLPEKTFPNSQNYYEHNFNYDSFGSNTGEIKKYTSPLGAETTYYFRSLVQISRGHQLIASGPDEAIFENYSPSRFLYMKVVDVRNSCMDSKTYTWKYNLNVHCKSIDDQSPYCRQSFDDTVSGDTIEENIAACYGNELPMTWVIDPDGNYTVYFWKRALSSCIDYGDHFFNQYSKKWWDSPDCPTDDNSYNGRLMKIMYFEGGVANANLRKMEIFNNEFSDNFCTGGVCPEDYDFGRGNGCHENDHVYKKNIRQYSKETKIFGPNGLGNGSVSTKTTYKYDSAGNIKEMIEYANGLPAITTTREYENPQINFGGFKYITNLLKKEEITNDDNTLLSRTVYQYNNYRVGTKKVWFDSGESSYISTGYGYDDHQLSTETIEGKTREFTYSKGALQSETRDGITFINNSVSNAGLIMSTTDSANNCTSFGYDNLFRRNWINPPDGRISTDIEYNDRTVKFRKNNQVEYLSFTFDKLGNIYGSQKLVDGRTIKTMDSRFDWRGLEKSSISPKPVSMMQEMRTSYDYDCLGRMTIIDDPDDNCHTSIEYYLATDKVDPTIVSGKCVTDDAGIVTNYFYDARGRLRRVNIQESTAGEARYYYDDMGNMICVANDLNIDHARIMEYDLMGRLKTLQEPESGETSFDYWESGQIKRKTTSLGSVYYQYDAAGRLDFICHDCEDREHAARYFYYDENSYICAGNKELVLENTNGRLSRIEDNTGGIILRSYDKHGDIKKEVLVADDCYCTSYSYNGWGALEGVQYPISGIGASYANNGSWATAIDLYDLTESDDPQPLVTSISYNPAGAVNSIDFSNNSKLVYSFDERSRIDFFDALRPDESSYFGEKIDYIYDENGRIKQIGSNYYGYDNNNSLISVTGNQEISYQYDIFGNLTSRGTNLGSRFNIVTFSYENNQITNAGFVYDANGNITYDPRTGYNLFFDRENRLINAMKNENDIISYGYDGEGKRRMTLANDQCDLYFYDLTGNDLIEKVSFQVHDGKVGKITKDECYVNLAGKNVARFDYYTPTPTPVPEISINFRDNPDQSVFHPGDHMTGDVNYYFSGSDQPACLYVLLELPGSSFYAWPAWNDNPNLFDYGRDKVFWGDHIVNFIDVDFPPGSYKMGPCYFHAFFLNSQPEGPINLFGNLVTKEFYLDDNHYDVYVGPGIVNGNGTLENPFISIQYAIDYVDPPHNNRATIKLLPGTYTLDQETTGLAECITMKERVDLIGSGQNRTTIAGNFPLNSIIAASDSTIQYLTSGVNVFCNGTSPILRDLRLINNGCEFAVGGYPGAHPKLVNCLISGYPCGIGLWNASATIQNCTISDCSNDAVFSKRDPLLENPHSILELDIDESIISFSNIGINIDGEMNVNIAYSNIFGNYETNFAGIPSVIGQNGNISADPLFVSVPGDHSYYLKSIDAGQSSNSPCINSGAFGLRLDKHVTGTTRKDGVLDQCRGDMGYHSPPSSDSIGAANLNNDQFALDDPRSVISKGPKDMVYLTQDSDVSVYFDEDCGLHQESDPPASGIIAADLSDVSGDGLKDLIVVDGSGAKTLINDGKGNFVEEKSNGANTNFKANCIKFADLNGDNQSDQILGTDNGTVICRAELWGKYSELQTLDTGITVCLEVADLNNDNIPDLIAASEDGKIQIFENNGKPGFERMSVVSSPSVHAIRTLDINGDRMLDIEVTVTPGVSVQYINRGKMMFSREESQFGPGDDCAKPSSYEEAKGVRP